MKWAYAFATLLFAVKNFFLFNDIFQYFSIGLCYIMNKNSERGGVFREFPADDLPYLDLYVDSIYLVFTHIRFPEAP